jgi:hypothetical protein
MQPEHGADARFRAVTPHAARWSDRELDLVLTTPSGELDVVTANGASLPGFPVQTQHTIGDAAVVADLDADGDQEVVVYVTGASPAEVHVYSHQGVLLDEFPAAIQETDWEDTGGVERSAWRAPTLLLTRVALRFARPRSAQP